MQHNPKAYKLSRPTARAFSPNFLVQLLVGVISVFIICFPFQAEAKKSHHRRRHHSHRSADYVANEGNRAAALAILSSEDDPSRKVAGLATHPKGEASVENSADFDEEGDETSTAADEEGTSSAAPWGAPTRLASNRQPSAADVVPHFLKLKSGVLQDQQIADLNLQKITHSLQRAARKRCSKKTCSKQLHHYVVQFNEHITTEDSLNVTSLGATILRYLPDDAFIIEAEAVEAYTIRGSTTSVKAVIPYQASWKLSSELSENALAHTDRDDRKVVQIRLFPTEEGQVAAQKLNEIAGVDTMSVSGRSLIVELPVRQLQVVAGIESVEWIELRQPLTLLMGATIDRQSGSLKFSPQVTSAMSESSHQRSNHEVAALTGAETGAVGIGASKAWNRGLNGQGQIVAVADSGFDYGDVTQLPPDFNGRVLEGQNLASSNSLHSSTSERASGARVWRDLFGHGTYLSELVLGSGAALNGRASGVAPGARLLPLKIWDELHQSVETPSKLRDLFMSAYLAGARIHLNTWGSSDRPGQYSMDAQQVDEFVQMNPDMLVVFAAGDNGHGDSKETNRDSSAAVVSPATAKNALTVGAANQAADAVAIYSAQGPTADGRTKPELVAPATNLLGFKSRAMDSHTQAPWAWGSLNDSYLWSGGSANAAAVTAGSAAVVRQYLIENRKIQRPSAALVKAVLMHGASGILSKRQTHAVPNEQEGFGRVNLDRETDLAEALIVDDHAGVAAGETHAYKIRISTKTKLSATLVYTDTPAALGASTSLVNDLDLAIVGKDGHEITLNDHLNNFESLSRELPAGNYQVLVRGFNVPQAPNGKQSYALIVSVE